MRIRYCPRCAERPYYELCDDEEIPFLCPFCSTMMRDEKVEPGEFDGKCMNSKSDSTSNLFSQSESIDEIDYTTCEEEPLSISIGVRRGYRTAPHYDVASTKNNSVGTYGIERPAVDYAEPKQRDYLSDSYVMGIVRRVVEGNNYRRNFIKKLSDRFAYGQRTGDVRNTILIDRIDANGRMTGDTIQVVIYGNIEGGSSSVFEGSELRATGKYIGKSEFYANSISVDGNVKNMEFERGDFRVISIPIILVLAFIIIVALISSFGTAGIASALGLFLILSGGAFIALLFLVFRSGWGIALSLRGGFPFRTCLIIALILGAILTYLFRGII